MEAIMKPLLRIAVAVLAILAGACADENALYTSPKYVPGYTPTGATGPGLAQSGQHDRNRDVDRIAR
jgi:hypothetical protein